MSHTAKERSRIRAFSLAELIVAIGILAVSILLVATIFGLMITGSQKASDLTAGSVVADGLLSQEIYQLMSVDNQRNRFFRATYAAPSLLTGGSYTLNNAVYFYKIYCQDVDLSASLHCNATDGARGSTPLKRLDVVVWWFDSGAAGQTNAQTMGISQATRAGMGLLQVHQSRIVWATGSH